ncbi:MAG: MMPL family transporter [Thermodesulfobacteriota bacterium]
MKVHSVLPALRTPAKALFLLAVSGLAILAIIKLSNIQLQTDVVNTLPQGQPVIDEGARVLSEHPYQNQIFIDLYLEQKDPDQLLQAAELVQNELRQSGLFSQVGLDDMGQLFPRLASHVTENLPVLFSAQELKQELAPLLQDEALQQRISGNISRLYTMQGTGSSELVLQDPLGLNRLVLKKLQHLVPAEDISFYKSHPLSRDQRHTFIIAEPKSSSTSSSLARRIQDALEKTNQALQKEYADTGLDFTLTPTGSYRAVLDNQTTAKQDTKRALLFVSLGIAFLLLLSFPRPYIGLLAFLPAGFGTICALAFYSLWQDSISVMSIGFGGAIISITVDHGISYLLFLDRPYVTSGKSVSREVRAVALLAVLTSVGAFFALSFSGFPILSEIGQFAALGIAFSFLFVHSFFPVLLPELRPAKRSGTLPLQALVDKLVQCSGKYSIGLALAALVFLSFFAHPDFEVDISQMNTVSQETLAAEEAVAETWGEQLFDKIYLLAEAPSKKTLQQHSDQLAAAMQKETQKDTLAQAFLPSEIFPAKERCQANLEAWQDFWSRHDLEQVQEQIQQAAVQQGLPADAFSDAYEFSSTSCSSGLPLKPDFQELLEIHQDQETGNWKLFTTLTPGENYDPGDFFAKFSEPSWVHVFDPDYYSQAISDYLATTFTRMLIIIGLSVTVLLLLIFMDPLLTLLALLPLGFSLLCTLGFLGLFNLPLSIPGLMLSVVVLGMGLDYSLYFIRGYQRYQEEKHPYQAHIRMTIFLAGLSTCIGFLTLASGEHSFMQNMGLVLLLGICFVLLGTFAFFPPLLRHLYQPLKLPEQPAMPGSARHKKRIHRLFKHLEAYPRLFARCKLATDPMFTELPELVGEPGVVADIGCGYGLTSAWLIAARPTLRVYAMDPDPERVRIAQRVLGPRGQVYRAGAPWIPDFETAPDLALMLDMLHYLSEAQLAQTLENLKAKLGPESRLLIRVTIPAGFKVPVFRKIESFRLRLRGIPAYFRSREEINKILQANGFAVSQVLPSGKGREETWFLARTHQLRQ